MSGGDRRAADGDGIAALLAGLGALLLPGGPEVVSLEPADLRLEAELLDALRAGGRRPRYQAVGRDRAGLEAAAAAAAARGVSAGAVEADLSGASGWDAIKAPPGGAARLVLVLGDGVGGLDPMALAAELRRLLRRGDRLLCAEAVGPVGAGLPLPERLRRVAACEVERVAEQAGRLLVLARPLA